MNPLRNCENATRAVVEGVPFMDRHGRDVLVVVARLTYVVAADGTVTLAERQVGLRAGDVWESSERRGLRHAGDLFEHKPGTDVVMVGSAHPPAGATEMVVSLSVAGHGRMLRKVVRVYGPRVFYAGVMGAEPGAAAALGKTPLRYELAYGGVAREDPDHPLIDWRNPVGTGVARRAAALVGRPAPQIEDPEHATGSRHPAPAGFGPIPSWWEPRSSFQGTHDLAWARERAPVLPADFDPRHYSVAPPGLWSEEPLTGDEWIEVVGARPEGAWRFQLPTYAPAFTSVIAGQIAEHPTHLETVHIDADAAAVELSWRVAVPLPRKAERLELVHVAERHAETLEPVLDATERTLRTRRHLPVVS